MSGSATFDGWDRRPGPRMPLPPSDELRETIEPLVLPFLIQCWSTRNSDGVVPGRCGMYLGLRRRVRRTAHREHDRSGEPFIPPLTCIGERIRSVNRLISHRRRARINELSKEPGSPDRLLPRLLCGQGPTVPGGSSPHPDLVERQLSTMPTSVPSPPAPNNRTRPGPD